MPQAEKLLVSAEKKQGKNTFGATYGVQDQAATLSWTNKPLKVGCSSARLGPALVCLMWRQRQCSALNAHGCSRPARCCSATCLTAPFAPLPQVVVRGKAGSEGVKGVQATLLVTKVSAALMWRLGWAADLAARPPRPRLHRRPGWPIPHVLPLRPTVPQEFTI